jgi:hypothetical protein
VESAESAASAGLGAGRTGSELVKYSGAPERAFQTVSV